MYWQVPATFVTLCISMNQVSIRKKKLTQFSICIEFNIVDENCRFCIKKNKNKINSIIFSNTLCTYYGQSVICEIEI